MRNIRRLNAALLCCAFAVVFAAGCYRPNEVAGPAVSEGAGAAADMQATALQGLRLHVFNTGMNRVSPLLVGSPAPWRPAPAFVIEHPGRGLIVFDCGLAEEVGREGEASLHPITRLLFKTRSLPGKDLASQMRAAGLDPGDVAYVILSHMHFDHVGAAQAFTKASFIAGPGARANSASRMNGFDPERTAWVDTDSWHEADFSRGEPFATFDSTLDVFSDGSLRLIRGGGHTDDGIAALLNLPGGPVLLAGDLAVHFDWLRGDDVQRIVGNAERAAEVRNRIRRLAEVLEDLVIIPGHDLSELPGGRDDLLLHNPELFVPSAWPVDDLS